MAEAETDLKVPLLNLQKNESSLSQEDPQQADKPTPKPVELTGVGIRTRDRTGKESLVDEALWDQSPTASGSEFALIVFSDFGRIVDLTIQSRFLVSIIMSLLPRADSMGVRKRHDSVSFQRPFIPLYWFYDRIIDAAGDPDLLSKDDSRDLSILRYWYEKHFLAWHVEIRNTLDSGYVTFDALWALYRPNDYAYTRDVFQQPQVKVVSSTIYDTDLDNPDPGYAHRIPNFLIVLWHQDWDSSLQLFKVEAEQFIIKSYAGSRRITDLEIYPLRYYHEGRQADVDNLLESLEARGRRWKTYVSRPNYMIHKGPAIQMSGSSSGAQKHVGPLVSKPRMTQRTDPSSNQIDERLIIDQSGFILYGYEEDDDNVRDQIPPLRSSINTEDFDDVLDEQDPSEDFSVTQAHLCPATVKACSPLTMEWFEVSIGNLTDMVWAKDAAKALVMADPKTKDTLVNLIQAHRSEDADENSSDVIRGKGQVNCFHDSFQPSRYS